MSLNSVLGSLDDDSLYIKSQLGYADYYVDYGWYGTLTDIDNYSMYK